MGAAIARVSGQVDIVEVLEGRNEDDVVAAACEDAKKKAVEAGADPDLVQVISIDNMPLEYVAMKATRLIIRAVSCHVCYTSLLLMVYRLGRCPRLHYSRTIQMR